MHVQMHVNMVNMNLFSDKSSTFSPPQVHGFFQPFKGKKMEIVELVIITVIEGVMKILHLIILEDLKN